MSDWIVLSGLFALVAAGLIAFGAYSIYGGVHASMKTAKRGDIFNFTYQQPLEGDPERFLAKVLDVHTLDETDIRRLNTRSRYRRDDPQFQRTRHLVTCQTADGKIRNFYAERTTNCRRPLLAGAFFKAGLAHLL